MDGMMERSEVEGGQSRTGEYHVLDVLVWAIPVVALATGRFEQAPRRVRVDPVAVTHGLEPSRHGVGVA